MPSVTGTYPAGLPGAITVVSGDVTAPAAAALVADTGALAAGYYDLEINLGFSGVLAAGKHIQVQHRDSANATTQNTYGLFAAGSGAVMLMLNNIPVAANERIRAVIGAVAGAASEVAHATIRATKVS